MFIKKDNSSAIKFTQSLSPTRKISDEILKSWALHNSQFLLKKLLFIFHMLSFIYFKQEGITTFCNFCFWATVIRNFSAIIRTEFSLWREFWCPLPRQFLPYRELCGVAYPDCSWRRRSERAACRTAISSFFSPWANLMCPWWVRVRFYGYTKWHQ